jgi:vancomycin resistance protein YoaR
MMRLPALALIFSGFIAGHGMPAGVSWAESPNPRAAARAAAETDFPVVLGSFSTTLLGSNPARTHNIRLAAAALDSVVLEPGTEVSFNDRVGRRSTERGYLVAPVILREERQLQLGGGICQVASTLFDAALVAGLTPVERWRHSSPVDYVALGEDATIAWGYKDLKLRNDSEQAVRLRVEIVGATLLARIEAGAHNERTYELRLEERDVPASTDANLPGREIELYRVHIEDGREIEREFVHRDLYPSARMAGR